MNVPKHPSLESFPVVIDQVVAWAEMDAFEHVNNVVYFRYFENARIAYFRNVGWMDDNDGSDIGPIVASTQARFLRPVVYPATLWIGARLKEIKDDRFTLEHHIVSQATQELTTIGECVVVAFDYRQKKKVLLPELLRKRIEQLEGKDWSRPSPSNS